ncbi:hypothetical protein QLH51_13115 [Sphingomonas sp. 2R-10]|uniref:hypothetical protein n=1 Tax=Sphingomonas sp. 2R-10 TaxID=3045148 RepID=UPI000F797E0B|nr:hypothetical protein [Sphingomonas sp. 2R-10]MDJ0277739.1 hypothetical protein [Sphingomonas sp. 2R-10]
MTDSPVKGDARYEVIPLTVQPEGDAFMVGSPQLGAFYQFPPEAVSLIDRLRDGATPDDIRRELSAGRDVEEFDVVDFVATLEEIGFVRPLGAPSPTNAVSRPPRTISFSVTPRTAALFFSRPAAVAYVLLAVTAAACAVRFPVARLHTDAFFIEDHLAATLVLLLALSSAATGLHELGHLLAAARRGVTSHLGIGTRLWNVVFEADLSGIFSLPREQRYLPLAAGMIVDLLVASAVTILITTLHLMGAPHFPIALLQALVLQIAVTVAWQFNLFLRTDVYFLLSNWSGHPNLDGAAREYIAATIHSLTASRFGYPQDTATPPRFLRMVRSFVSLWIVGRVLSLATLLFVVLPTLARYAERAWRTIHDPAAPAGRGLDAALFAGISALLVALGLLLWLLPKFKGRGSRISR